MPPTLRCHLTPLPPPPTATHPLPQAKVVAADVEAGGSVVHVVDAVLVSVPAAMCLRRCGMQRCVLWLRGGWLLNGWFGSMALAASWRPVRWIGCLCEAQHHVPSLPSNTTNSATALPHTLPCALPLQIPILGKAPAPAPAPLPPSGAASTFAGVATLAASLLAAVLLA